MLLDADVLIDLIRCRAPAQAWFTGLPAYPAASGVAAPELAYGATSAVELRNVQRFLRPFPVLWPTEEDSRRAFNDYALLHPSHGVEVMDAITAAIAIGQGMGLATFNVRHYRPIPGLTLLQPYSR